MSYNHGFANVEVSGKHVGVGAREGNGFDKWNSESFPLLSPGVYKNGQGFLKGWKTAIWVAYLGQIAWQQINLKGIEKGCSVSAVGV